MNKKRAEILERANQLGTYFDQVIKLKSEINALKETKERIAQDTELIKKSIGDEQKKYNEKCKAMKSNVDVKEREHIENVRAFHVSITGMEGKAKQILLSAALERKSIVALKDKLSDKIALADTKAKELDDAREVFDILNADLDAEKAILIEKRKGLDLAISSAESRLYDANMKMAEVIESIKVFDNDIKTLNDGKIALNREKKLIADAVRANAKIRKQIDEDSIAVGKEKAKIAIDKETIKNAIAENLEKKKDLDFKENLLLKLETKLSEQKRLMNKAREE